MGQYLVTGANRGIGLEYCRQLASRGEDVIAVCRKGSGALEDLGLRVEVGVDMTDDASVEGLALRLRDTSLDVLINNAGTLEVDSLVDMDLQSIRRQFEVNALGPLRVTRALLGNLKSGSKVIIMTSLMGSLGDNTSGGFYGYRMSKAAVSMAGVSLACDLRSKGIAVGILHPGMVATDMTGHSGIPVKKSVQGLLERIDGLSLESSGTFLHADGKELPW